MTTKKMLIDATHPEETRVVIVAGNRLDDFDVEVESRRQLKGNIYLAKVTRVEPSLQAAFVDYGGNRHGFLAFNEIHPDYYQIPVADREALIAEDEADGSDDDAETESTKEGGVETLGGDDSEEVEARRPVKNRRHYKIQEVIKRRQILLIQVVKEERGTKGAALTTYLSLAGRYCVLMPNTARGGGISRKIANGADRKRLKTILNDLKIPKGMAVIVRTAGSKRSKAEIKRDYEYLTRLWSNVREHTLESIAPCLIHEEGNLIKRSIRDLYTKDIEEVIVDGDEGYRAAKDFMKLLIPSHAKRVQPHKDKTVSITHAFHVEGQLDAIHSPEVQLKSGGYIVINPTEALVSIDVNSGRATKERNIEETALKTNLEAATEIARQLRLRDLSGLIVIDFIDMEVNRNQTKVERQFKDAMRSDRARIQIGRISPFGLLELSRQRLRPSLIETSSEPCPHCGGTGTRRSTESTALQMLRVIEDEGAKRRAESVTVFMPTSVALYLLNQKRQVMAEIEERCSISIFLENDDSLIPPDYRIEWANGETSGREDANAASRSQARPGASGTAEEGGKRRRRRRGRGRKGRDSGVEAGETPAENEPQEAAAEASPDDEQGSDEETATGGEKRRRRGRRGGRRRGRKSAEKPSEVQTGEAAADDSSDAKDAAVQSDEQPAAEAVNSEDAAEVIALPDGTGDADEAGEAKPKPRRRKAKSADDDGKKPAEKKPATRRRTRKAAPKKDAAAQTDADTATPDGDQPVQAEAPAKEKRPRRAKRKVKDESTDDQPADVIPMDVPAPAADPAFVVAAERANTTVIDVESGDSSDAKAGRKGWWNRPGS